MSTTAVTAEQVGSYFVETYFKTYREQKENLHKFYTDPSSVIRVNGDVNKSASGMKEINQLIMSSNFTNTEIDTTNCLESWAGGFLVTVSGSVKSENFSGSRKFVQNFFLAPQETGYFVLNDVFHLYDEGSVHQLETEQNVDHVPVPEHPLEEPKDHVEEDLPVQEYSYEDHQAQHNLPAEPEAKGPEALKEYSIATDLPKDDSSVLPQNTVQVPQTPPKEDSVALDLPKDDSSALSQNIAQPPPKEPVEEPRTYASILRSKGKSPALLRAPTDLPQNPPPAARRKSVSQPQVKHPSPIAKVSEVNSPKTVVEKDKEVQLCSPVTLVEDKGESHSIYVKNLPFTVTNLDILDEFKNFGKIKDDGIFLRNRKDTGVCFAFVEFEDVESVQSAIKASPIQLLGRRVYIEERRSIASTAARGRGERSARGGRGRGGRGRSFGRGSKQNGGDSKMVSTN